MTDTKPAPERIFVAYAGDHMRYWGREPSPSLDCTEYVRADARPVPEDDVEGLARAAQTLLDDLEDAGLAKWQAVWNAMREDARHGDMPAAMMEGLRALAQKETGR